LTVFAPPSSSVDPSASASAPAGAAIAIAVPSQLQGAPGSVGLSPLSVSALATVSIGGVVGTDGAPASSASLVQYASASPASALTTGLLVLGTSMPLLGYAEPPAATPDESDGVEPPPPVDPPTVDSSATPPAGRESRVPPAVGDFPDIRPAGLSMSDRPAGDAEAAPIPMAAADIPETPASPAEQVDSSPRTADLARHDWTRARAYILAFTGFALGAYAHRRGLGGRADRREGTRNRTEPEPTRRLHLRGVTMGRVDA
jgi:hypothetical protein